MVMVIMTGDDDDDDVDGGGGSNGDDWKLETMSDSAVMIRFSLSPLWLEESNIHFFITFITCGVFLILLYLFIILSGTNNNFNFKSYVDFINIGLCSDFIFCIIMYFSAYICQCVHEGIRIVASLSFRQINWVNLM